MKYAVWLLPFVMPFVVLGLLRSLFYASGAAWLDPGFGALMSLTFGVGIGCIAALAYNDNAH